MVTGSNREKFLLLFLTVSILIDLNEMIRADLVSIHSLYRCLCVDLRVDYRTRKYILARLSVEGISFVTKVLPKLSKVVILGLTLDNFEKARTIERFTEIRHQGKSLHYFRSFLDRIFSHNGRQHSDKESVGQALRDLRQLCEVLYKLVEKISKSTENKAWYDYCEDDDKVSDSVYTDEYQKYFLQKARGNVKYYNLNATVDEILHEYSPRFTSGSFSEASKVTDMCRFSPYAFKFLKDDWIGNYSGSDQAKFLLKYPRFLRLTTFNRKVGIKPPMYKTLLPDNGNAPSARFSTVPKDSRGPRIICMEPLHSLPYQMIYFDYMSNVLQRVTRGRINFTDQEQNQNLAFEGSMNQEWCTFDLEKGSDRVSLKKTEYLMRDQCPGLLSLINAFRSREVVNTRLNKKKKLNKLAGMGSGFTFATMAFLIHLAVCTMAVLTLRIPFTKAMSLAYVYGDDLITPKAWSWFVPRALELFGFKLNASKSFTHGYFRESCGKDYYAGVETQPVRIKTLYEVPYDKGCTPVFGIRAEDKHPVPPKIGSVLSFPINIESLTSFTNDMYQRGYYKSFAWGYDNLEKLLGFAPPSVEEGSPILGVKTEIPSVESGICLVKVKSSDRESVFCEEKLYNLALRSKDHKRLELPPCNAKKRYKVVDLGRAPHLIYSEKLKAEMLYAR